LTSSINKEENKGDVSKILFSQFMLYGNKDCSQLSSSLIPRKEENIWNDFSLNSDLKDNYVINTKGRKENPI